jgi:hypothetical protein
MHTAKKKKKKQMLCMLYAVAIYKTPNGSIDADTYIE